MTTSDTTSTYARALRTLYVVRFGFAIVWAGILFTAAAAFLEPHPLLTVLLVVYPLIDAGAVLWQLRADPDSRRSKVAEWVNVAVSAVVAIALGIASSISVPAALAVWGAWAISAGVPQLVTAIRNRRSGGQVPQMLSGGISVFAGTAFLIQGLQGSSMIAGAAGYATLGAIFFLISAIRLSIMLRRARA